MNKETELRIEKDAHAFYPTLHLRRMGYIIGAMNEHPKAWNAAIDACIQKLWDGAKPDKLWTEYQKDLEALKLDPNQA